MATAEGAESYVPHDPEMGGPRLEYVSTVVESAEVLRQVAAAIFIENRGLFSNGRRRLAASGLAALASSLVGYGLEMIGIGAAIENMWIAAQSLGIQAAFMGDVAVAEDEIARVLGIQGDLAGVLALGFSEEPVPSPRPARDAADAVHVVWHRGG